MKSIGGLFVKLLIYIVILVVGTYVIGFVLNLVAIWIPPAATYVYCPPGTKMSYSWDQTTYDAPGQTSLDLWNLVNINRLQKQMPYPILPVYIEQAPVGDNTNLPFRTLPDPDLSEEGINAGYATMWFIFTALLIFGYPLYLRKQTPDTSGRQ